MGNNLLASVLMLFTVATNTFETRDRVAVIDTGISRNVSNEYICIDGHFDSTGTGIYDDVNHGAFVTQILAYYINPKTQCLTMLKWKPQNPWSLLATLKQAAALKPKYLNMSLGGFQYSLLEQALLNEMLKNGTSIAVSAGNNRLDLSKNCNYFPACYRFSQGNFYVVASCTKNNTYEDYTNYGGMVNACDDGDIYTNGGQYLKRGTSFATPRYLGKKINGRR